MKITKSGFYKLSEFDSKSLEVEKNISVVFFDDGKINKQIFVGEKSEVYICGLLKKEDDYNIKIFQKEKSSKIFVNYLLFSKNNEKVKARIYSKIESDFSESKLNIVCFVDESGEIVLDGILEFEKNFKEMKGKLDEDNIFLGKNGKIRGIPTLLVSSNNVEASHSCKIHKIDDEKLFYLRSRGIQKDDSIFMLTQAKIENTFGKIKEFDKVFFAKICKSILFN